jgi:DNA-binding NarL/FixJ family response regulator
MPKTESMTIRLVLADDHTLVRQGLRQYLEMGGDIDVVGEASTGQEVLDQMESKQPDVVVLDLRMPGMDGLEVARRIQEHYPDVGVMMLSAYDYRQFVVEAVRAGARGYVLKSMDADQLVQAVHLVAAGNMVFDPQVVVALAEELSRAKEREQKGDVLTSREIEVLQLLAFGHSNKDIADRMAISAETVKTHLEHIFRKLGTSDRTAAVAEALRRRVIE